MGDTRTMRASDRDRQDVVDRLRSAVGDGRLRMDEYMERMERAYEAVTYRDLAPLHADLPASGSPASGSVAERGTAVSPVMAPPTPSASRCLVAGLPVVLRVLWAIWLTALLVNVVVWALVSGTTGHLMYPWPLWVAGPYGAALFAVSAVVSQIRGSRARGSRRVSARRG
jgi:Domain of unknown function (DUF1707)